MAQVPPGFDATQPKNGSVASPTRAVKFSRPPLQVSAEIPSEKPFRAPLKIDYTQAAGDLPTTPIKGRIATNGSKGIPPTVLRHVTAQPYKYNETSPTFASVKAPGSVVQPKEPATSIPNAPPLPITAASNKTARDPKDSKGLPPSILRNVTPQPYKYIDTNPTFASVHAPGSAIKPNETAFSIRNAPPVTNPAGGSNKISGAPKDSQGIPPSLLSHVTPQPYKYHETNPTFASVKAPGSAVQPKETAATSIPNAPPLPITAASNKTGPSGNSNDNRRVPESQPVFPNSVQPAAPVGTSTAASDVQNRLILAPNGGLTSVSTGSQASSFAYSTVSSVPTPVNDSTSKKHLSFADHSKSAQDFKLQNSERSSTKFSQPSSSQGFPEPGRKSEQEPSSGSGRPSDRTVRGAASVPSARHSVGFAQPPVSKVVELRANLTDPTNTESNINETAKTDTERKKSGTNPLAAKTDTEPKKSGTKPFSAKSDPAPRKSGTTAVPNKPDPSPNPAKPGTEGKKSERGPRRSISGTDIRIGDPASEYSVQSNIDIFESKRGSSHGVGAASKKSDAKVPQHVDPISSKKSDLSSNRSDLGSSVSALSQDNSRNQQINPGTNIVSSSSRPRLTEPGYKRSIPQQAPNQPTRKSSATTGRDGRRGTQPSEVKLSSVVARKGSSVHQSPKSRQSSVNKRPRQSTPDRRRDVSEKRTSGGDNCKLQDKGACRFENCSPDCCDDKTRKSELDKCSPNGGDKTRKSELEKNSPNGDDKTRKSELGKCPSACDDKTPRSELEKGSPNGDDKTRKSELEKYSACNRKIGNRDCENRNASCDAVMPTVYPITAGSPDACLSVCQWQPTGVSATNCCDPCPQQRRSCYPPQSPYRSRPMCDPCYTSPCDTRPCPQPCPRPTCPRPCPRPCSPCPRPRCPRPCSPCQRPICPGPCSPCPWPRPCSPCPRPICPRPCSPPACSPCDPLACPPQCSPRQCTPCDRPPMCPPRPCSPCLPPVISIWCPSYSGNSCCPPPPPCPPPKDCCNVRPQPDCCEAPNCYTTGTYPCRDDCDPDCDPNRCKPLVKPASREVPDNFKCIPNQQQQFLINACLRNAAAATATATNIYGGLGCSPEPLCDTDVNGGAGCGVLRRVSPCEIGRNRCVTLRPTPELQRILDYRRQIEDEWEAMDEYCCEHPDYGY